MILKESQQHSNIIRFKANIQGIIPPAKFTYPFDYTPHPLALLASIELQEYLLNQTDWSHSFGPPIDQENEGMGKMFGVLVVKDQKGNLGYLSAFSGILADQTCLPHFVPPIYNRQEDGNFYDALDQKILKINNKITELKSATLYLQLKNKVTSINDEAKQVLSQEKKEIKTAKKLRDKKRKWAKENLSIEEFKTQNTLLGIESMHRDRLYKNLAKDWRIKTEQTAEELIAFEAQIQTLKNLRKRKSANMQKLLFEQYQFLNYKGETKSVLDIFESNSTPIPPSGAGDCAAPKLLQYAYQNNLTPITMAEFWWGKSPALEVRKHKIFYPACRTKCLPIFGHMLQGLEMDPNPISLIETESLIINTLYEDDTLLIIDKPAELLSVPGKQITDSVETRLKAKYPEATGPMLAHRLDMSTSGLMVITKTLEAHRLVQEQFANRTIKKRYTAVLDGVIKSPSGIINLPLRVDLNNRPTQVVCYDHGKNAETRWEVDKIVNKKTRIHFYPKTGRTHQLRVHASHPLGLNTPIIGDELYGSRKNRLHLHADFIEFVHPTTKKLLSFHCPVTF